MSRRLLSLLSLLLLAACTTTGLKLPIQRPTSVELMRHWQLDGRIALKQGDEGFSAGLHWLESPGSTLFELSGPLGETRARLNGSPGSATLELPNEPPLSGADPERLLAEHFGWGLPVESLKRWLRGLPDPGSEALELDPQGRPIRFSSRGWQVRYLAWQEVQGLTLPKRIEAHNDQLTLKLSLHDWQF